MHVCFIFTSFTSVPDPCHLCEKVIWIERVFGVGESFGKSSVILFVIKKWSVPGTRVSGSFKLCEFILSKILSSFLFFEASQPRKIFFSFTLENGRGRTRITRCTTGSFNAAVAYLPGDKSIHVWKFLFYFGGTLLHLCYIPLLQRILWQLRIWKISKNKNFFSPIFKSSSMVPFLTPNSLVYFSTKPEKICWIFVNCLALPSSCSREQ